MKTKHERQMAAFLMTHLYLEAIRSFFASSIVTIKTTKNFWDALALTLKARLFKDQGIKAITFRGDGTMNLSWREYVALRPIVANGYVVEKSDDIFIIEKANMKIAGPANLLGVVNENLGRIYQCDCKDRVVLDVGGFIGDTAVLFAAWGARKVIIYEPVRTYHRFIKINVMLNDFEAELHEEGIGSHSGREVIHYDALDCTFGLESHGKREEVIQIRDVEKVIRESHAYVAKFDCEGAEKNLSTLTSETLRLIHTYLVEVHTSEIRRSLLARFQEAGFDLKREWRNHMDDEVSVLVLARR